VSGGVNRTPKFWWENALSQSWAGKWSEAGTVHQSFGRKTSCLKVGWESGRFYNGTPGGKTSCLKVGQETGGVGNCTVKFWRESTVFPRLAGKLSGAGMVRQSFGGKTPSHKVGLESGRGRERYAKVLSGQRRVSKLGTPNIWRENVLSQS
jgi:hypothetical protein